MDSRFWAGLRLVAAGLGDAARKASYSAGCGAGGLGFALWGVEKLGIAAPASILIAMAAFFLLARLGRVLDVRADRRRFEATLEELLILQQRISEQQLKVTQEQANELKNLAAKQKEYLQDQSRMIMKEIAKELDRRLIERD